MTALRELHSAARSADTDWRLCVTDKTPVRGGSRPPKVGDPADHARAGDAESVELRKRVPPILGGRPPPPWGFHGAHRRSRVRNAGTGRTNPTFRPLPLCGRIPDRHTDDRARLQEVITMSPRTQPAHRWSAGRRHPRLVRRVASGTTGALVVGIGMFVGVSSAAAAVPSFPDNLLIFPNRDFVSVEGYSGSQGRDGTGRGHPGRRWRRRLGNRNRFRRRCRVRGQPPRRRVLGQRHQPQSDARHPAR